MAKKDCPYCEGSKQITIANSNVKMDCDYCVKGVIPKLTETPGMFSRIKTFFNGDLNG